MWLGNIIIHRLTLIGWIVHMTFTEYTSYLHIHCCQQLLLPHGADAILCALQPVGRVCVLMLGSRDGRPPPLLHFRWMWGIGWAFPVHIGAMPQRCACDVLSRCASTHTFVFTAWLTCAESLWVASPVLPWQRDAGGDLVVMLGAHKLPPFIGGQCL